MTTIAQEQGAVEVYCCKTHISYMKCYNNILVWTIIY